MIASAGFPASSSDLARSRRGEVEEFWANAKSGHIPREVNNPWDNEGPKLPSTNNTTVRSNVFMSETVGKG
jgi:hypothetical protein